MKIIAFSDWRRKKVGTILEYLQNIREIPDLIVYAGDDINEFNTVERMFELKKEENSFDGEDSLKVLEIKCEEDYNYFQQVASHSKFGLCVVAGNDDTFRATRLIRGTKVYNVHEDPLLLNDIAIIGLEGSVGPIGFLLYTEKGVKKHLDEKIEKVGKKDIILVSHQPPKNVLDFAIRFGKGRIGSRALRSFIKKYDSQIKLVICGHVHSQGGRIEYLGDVPVINCASHDGFDDPGIVAIVELDANRKIKLSWERLYDRITECKKVPLIGPKRSKVLFEHQIHTIKELVHLPRTHPLFNHPSFKGSLPLIISHAKAIFEEKMMWMEGVRKPLEPLADLNIYFFDAEYDPEADSFGMFLLGWMDQQGTVTQLFVENPQKEKQVLQDFSTWLEEEDPLLVAYGSTSADEPQLRKRFEHFDIDTKILDNRFFDLYRNIIFTQTQKKQKLFLPLTDNSLKTVSRFLGYEKDDTSIHEGLEALMTYYDYLRLRNKNKKQSLKEELLLYNQEDLIQAKIVWEFLNQLGERQNDQRKSSFEL